MEDVPPPGGSMDNSEEKGVAKGRNEEARLKVAGKCFLCGMHG
jgi:hypothetical protein